MVEPDWISNDGNVILYRADCLDVLPTLGPVDAVVTDPPYGIYACGGTWGHKADLQWDKKAADILHLLDLAPIIAIWGGNYFPLPPSRGWLVWHKPDSVPSAADAELCWTNQDMNTRYLRHSIAATNGERVGHPTQKPVRVMHWTMEMLQLPERLTVLDPYMGSGTTGVACVKTGRKFIGIEIDPEYFDIAKHRIENELNATPLLDEIFKINYQQLDLLGDENC